MVLKIPAIIDVVPTSLVFTRNIWVSSGGYSNPFLVRDSQEPLFYGNQRGVRFFGKEPETEKALHHPARVKQGEQSQKIRIEKNKTNFDEIYTGRIHAQQNNEYIPVDSFDQLEKYMDGVLIIDGDNLQAEDLEKLNIKVGPNEAQEEKDFKEWHPIFYKDREFPKPMEAKR